MYKCKVLAVILLTAVLISGEAYCQQAINDKQVLTISGKVTYVDTEGWVIAVQTDVGNMLFHYEAESDMYRITHHISSIEIAKGDPVVIKYIHSSGRNNIIKLVDNSVGPY